MIINHSNDDIVKYCYERYEKDESIIVEKYERQNNCRVEILVRFGNYRFWLLRFGTFFDWGLGSANKLVANLAVDWEI